MEGENHKILSSQLIYKYNLFEIILYICESLLGDNVFFCFTRRNFKSNDEVKSNNLFFEFTFFGRLRWRTSC